MIIKFNTCIIARKFHFVKSLISSSNFCIT
nr:MAG TPA: hypothetical protein [Caudoviricetes sp.]